MGYAGFLRFPRSFSLRLAQRRHEADQGIANSLLHWIASRAVEGQTVDDGSDDHAAAHELADIAAHVGIVSPETVDPSHDQGIASAKQVEQAPTLVTLRERCRDAGYAVVGH